MSFFKKSNLEILEGKNQYMICGKDKVSQVENKWNNKVGEQVRLLKYLGFFLSGESTQDDMKTRERIEKKTLGYLK